MFSQQRQRHDKFRHFQGLPSLCVVRLMYAITDVSVALFQHVSKLHIILC